MKPRQLDPAGVNLPKSAALLKRFSFEMILGQGGSGTVYLVRDRNELGQLKAIKVLSSSVIGDEVSLARFYREGKVARSIRSPYVVPCYEIILDDGFFAITMEYVEGQNLGEYLELNQRPRPGVLVRILWEISQGLAEIHAHGLIHRDLKPQNVLLDADLRARITDFGVARMTRRLPQASSSSESLLDRLRSVFQKTSSNKSDALTLSGSLIGTVDYLAPEYVEHDVLDVRSDVFALGVIAYQMLAAELPYPGSSMFDRLCSRIHNPPPDIRIKAPSTPPRLSDFVNGCLQRDPTQRIQSASEAGTLLEEVARELGVQLGNGQI